MGESKAFSKINVNLPFPYPLINPEQKTIWPFKEEGFVLIYATLDRLNKLVMVKDTAAIFTVIKMGFFGFNSNKEINHFCLLESLNNNERKQANSDTKFTLGFYSINSVDIPPALNDFQQDVNKQKEPPSSIKPNNKLTSLKLTLEEAYFLSYIFGLLVIEDDTGRCHNLKELWVCFCNVHDSNDSIQFAAKYAAYHYLRSNGWIVRNGFKFGVDYLLYKEGPPFFHAYYSVIVTYCIDEKTSTSFTWNEISLLTRVTKNSRKKLLLCTVSIPNSILPDISLGPDCIQHFTVDFVHVNRWNSSKGEFDPTKMF